MSTVHDLRRHIRTCMIIDNHAHNLLRPEGQRSHEFLTISTEAFGSALEDTKSSLSHFRALVQLRTLYGLPEDADWSAISKKREEILADDSQGLIRKCLSGTQTLLLDDGLGSPDEIENYDWHDAFTVSPCKRIVRIETVAADILSNLHRQNKLPVGVAVGDGDACHVAWVQFITAFEQAIVEAISDDQVVGFKSVICYRTGLDVVLGPDGDVSDAGLRSFRRHYLPHCTARDFRVEAKGMNDALVISTCKLISAGFQQSGHAKPLQFHTGLGDNDISLLESNPAYLQPLIAEFVDVPIVLLHTSYPYTREAGYLAMSYKNAYLDVGEVFMMVSRDGLEKIVRQALELSPISKILYSSDGHHFPETYWLANNHGRETIASVLCDYVAQGDLTLNQAFDTADKIFFDNSNSLYQLGLAKPDRGAGIEQPTNIESSSQHSRDLETVREVSSASVLPYEKSKLSEFLSNHGDVKFVFVQWLDFFGQIRSRCVPVREFEAMIENDSRISIAFGNLGTTQIDHPSSVCNLVGAICVEPDLSSLRKMQDLGPIKNASTVMARHTEEDGTGLDLCPRSSLQKDLEAFRKEYQITFLVGFEIEITFCRRHSDGGEDYFSPLDTVHSWGTMSDEQYMTGMPLMMSITSTLRDMGIMIQQMHSEAGPGQYEFVLPPLPPIEAIDTLIQARQAITQIAATHKLRATCHTQPFPGIGTATHAHVSFNSPIFHPAELEPKEMNFMASVLTHLPALSAFTMPQEISYARAVDNCCTCGSWVAWGTQNREVPLRRVNRGRRWEIRCLDGLANMYLALHAVFAVGLAGLRRETEMHWRDCQENPAQFSEAEREAHGITTKLPTSLKEALHALDQDADVEAALSPGIVRHYLALKEAEQEMLNDMTPEKRRVWLMERY